MKATTLETQLKNLKAARKLGRDDLALRVDPAAFAAFRSEHEAAAAAAAVAAKPVDESECAPLLEGGSRRSGSGGQACG